MNTGKMEGTEIIQVYVRKRGSEGPVKTLRSFKRVRLAPKEKSDIMFELDPSFFEWYNDSIHKMSVSPGYFEIYYSTSSDEKDLKRINVRRL